jgi:thioredoxin reductase (NADPH)
MGLIKNSVEQGQQAIENIVKNRKSSKDGVFDIIIIGAGPAGISAALAAKKNGLSAIVLEQDSLGGTVYTFPREKIVMTSPMDLPLHGKVKLYETSKDELLQLWHKVIAEHNIKIIENTKVEDIIAAKNDTFKIITKNGQEFSCNAVLLSIGRRGSPRKLNIPGENSSKVAYRLLEPERISNKKIMVVGGGDSAIESDLLLKDHNEVILSYRNDKFSRLKPKNKDKINEAIGDGTVKVLFNSNLQSIHEDHILIKINENEPIKKVANDLIYIFAGGELPTAFLQKAGVQITKRFGHIVKKYR